MTSLTSDREPNNLAYRVTFCVIIHKSYKLLKTVCFGAVDQPIFTTTRSIIMQLILKFHN